MKSSASGGYDLCGIPARWAWIPIAEWRGDIDEA